MQKNKRTGGVKWFSGEQHIHRDCSIKSWKSKFKTITTNIPLRGTFRASGIPGVEQNRPNLTLKCWNFKSKMSSELCTNWIDNLRTSKSNNLSIYHHNYSLYIFQKCPCLFFPLKFTRQLRIVNGRKQSLKHSNSMIYTNAIKYINWILTDITRRDQLCSRSRNDPVNLRWKCVFK